MHSFLLLLFLLLSTLTFISAQATSAPTTRTTRAPTPAVASSTGGTPTTSAPTISSCLVDPCIEAKLSGICEFGCIKKDGCNYICKDPSLGETVRTISFQISYPDSKTTKDIDAAMRLIAEKANIPASDYIINDGDFSRIGTTVGAYGMKMGKWQIKIGFRAFPGGDDRERFIAALKTETKSPNLAVTTLSIQDSPLAGLMMDENEPVSQGKKYYATQTCPSGQVIGAQEQCSDIAATSAMESSQSSSTSMSTAIIAAIIGGAVVVAIIAIMAIIIIHRRRMNVVKSMEGCTTTTTTTGEQHV